jgi:hypothetical protein
LQNLLQQFNCNLCVYEVLKKFALPQVKPCKKANLMWQYANIHQRKRVSVLH